jgi:hypothetical protein
MDKEQIMEHFEKFMNFFSGPNALEVLLLLMVIVAIYVMARLHSNKDTIFNIADLICVGGKLDEKKFTRFGAWVISTWGFLYILVSNPHSFPEWYFMAYMGIWTAQVVVDKFLNKDNQSHQYSKPVEGSAFSKTPVTKPAYSAKTDSHE